MNDISHGDDFITNSVIEYSDMIYRIALNITKNPDDAFDICQDVFVSLVRNTGKIKSHDHLKAWLITSTVNRSKSVCTQGYKKHTVALCEADNLQAPKQPQDFSVYDCVMKLPQKYSSVIHLFYYEDLKISEIAKTLGITQSGVKSRLLRAKRLLRAIIEKEKNT